jgi:hypothetical protein
VKYGLGVLATTMQCLLTKLGVVRPERFQFPESLLPKDEPEFALEDTRR